VISFQNIQQNLKKWYKVVQLIARLVSKKPNKETNKQTNKEAATFEYCIFFPVARLLAGTSSKFPTRDYFRSDKI